VLERRPSKPRQFAAVCAVVLAVAVVGAVGAYLALAQADARTRTFGDFDVRARLAASVTSDTLTATDSRTREWAATSFTGRGGSLDAALDAARTGVNWLAVLQPDGTLVGASPRSQAEQAASLRTNPGFRLAVATGRLSYGDVKTEQGVAVVYGFQPYTAGEGARVLVVPAAASDVASLLRSVLDVTASRAYVVDSTGAMVVASDHTPAGSAIPDKRLAAAAHRIGKGVVGDAYYLTLPIDGSAWRAVIATSRSGLLAPTQGANRVAWLVFAGFAAAVTLTIIVGTSTIIGSARLAHARLHDALTGLPGRALFLDETRTAIAHKRTVAVLFLDLDGFKPVNDTYGHAAGDQLLVEVAQRLKAATRLTDFVGRFGGDEFLVLCRDPGDDHNDTTALAERIRDLLSRPFEIDGHTVCIGASIGIATLGPGTDTAEALIRNADCALYEAKRNGGGRVEHRAPDSADVHR
jgi:diguanylate cyclase (GGDEF)-like protein